MTAPNTIKVYIFSYGDPSVGIPAHHTEIDLDIERFHDPVGDERAIIKEQLFDFFAPLWDDNPYVLFSDEYYYHDFDPKDGEDFDEFIRAPQG